MPKFSKKSKAKLNTCDKRLIELFNKVVKKFDCTIIEGHRSKDRQNKLFDEGKSKLQYPNGKHNATPSMAVDVAPYPIDWNDRERFTYFAGYVVGIAYQMGLKIRWGGDWDMDTQVKDNNFDDLPHFEIKE
jgi:peptidoglycan LD-endopeptidase CwlK